LRDGCRPNGITAQGRPQRRSLGPAGAQRRPARARAPRRAHRTRRGLSPKGSAPIARRGRARAPHGLQTRHLRLRMPEPAALQPPPTHPFLFPTCPKITPASGSELPLKLSFEELRAAAR
jgi:hypothetical protein